MSEAQNRKVLSSVFKEFDEIVTQLLAHATA